jgi:regulatory protein
LHQRGYSHRAAREAVAKCRELGYVDDAALAGSLVGRHARAGHGKGRVIADMRRRGISNEAAIVALSEIDEDDEVVAATSVAQKLYERELKKGDVDDGARRRIAAALQRRGYASGVILRALRAVRT